MKKKVISSQLCNKATYEMYKRQMLTLAENVFEFDNLPTYIDTAYMNNVLLTRGSIAFFRDEVLGILALPYSVIGQLDVYGRPTQIMAHAHNGKYFRRLKSDEFVIMYDNNGRYPIYIDICQMAERIAMNKRTIDINIVQQRTPRIWKTNNDTKLSLEQILNEVDGMAEKVVTYDALDIDDMNSVLAPAPYVSDKIDMHIDKEWAEFYRLIGVANLIEQKRERMIRDEMSASQGGTIASRWSRFEPRQRAVEEINKKLLKDGEEKISVHYYDGEPDSNKEVVEDVEQLSISENIQ